MLDQHPFQQCSIIIELMLLIPICMTSMLDYWYFCLNWLGKSEPSHRHIRSNTPNKEQTLSFILG